MGRKIILLSDGTGNSAAKVWRTNVWRTFEALDLSGSDQVAYYDDGVGTSSFKPLAVIGGVFGYGLKRNVIALYKFACRNCRDDPTQARDQIYAFGFSRGAFTIRIVVGLILSEGLVVADNESDLQRGAVDAYRRYRRKTSHTLWPGRPEDMFRNVRDASLDGFRALVGAKPLAEPNYRFKIRFVGVWDTVAAYGLPIDEMTRGVSNWILPLALPNHKFDPAQIDRGCQALALDEERTTFHPELWNETGLQPHEIDITRRRFVDDEIVSQVWFAGVHSNIGGGYPDDSLAYIPFLWMILQAQRAGLRFKSDDPTDPGLIVADPDTFKSAMSRGDKDGRMYDPRKGIGGYYRYGPRKLVEVCTPRFRKKEDDEIVVHRPKIHETVFRRISNNAHAYAPIGLPAIYDIVTIGGEILTPDQYRTLHPTLGETNHEAAHRAQAQEHVWNEVWKRRCTYFATLIATFWLIGFPFLSDPEKNAETYSQIRWVSTLIRKLGALLPGFAGPWIEGFARQPLVFAASAGLLVVCLSLGAYQAGRIRDVMGSLWRRLSYRPRGEPRDWIYGLRSNEIYKAGLFKFKRSWAPAFFAFVFLAVAYFGLNKMAFLVYDTAGFTCKEATKENGLLPLRTVWRTPIAADFDISDPCNRTGIFLEGNGARYRIRIKMGQQPEDQWRDASTAVPPGGFIGSEADPRYISEDDLKKPNHLVEAAGWSYRLRKLAALPFRRSYQYDWLRLIVRIGAVGAIEDAYRPDVHDRMIQWTITPAREGELFIYVNDTILGLPTAYGIFYRENFGKGTITVQRL